jgi:hypothetical protein
VLAGGCEESQLLVVSGRFRQVAFHPLASFAVESVGVSGVAKQQVRPGLVLREGIRQQHGKALPSFVRLTHCAAPSPTMVSAQPLS